MECETNRARFHKRKHSYWVTHCNMFHEKWKISGSLNPVILIIQDGFVRQEFECFIIILKVTSKKDYCVKTNNLAAETVTRHSDKWLICCWWRQCSKEIETRSNSGDHILFVWLNLLLRLAGRDTQYSCWKRIFSSSTLLGSGSRLLLEMLNFLLNTLMNTWTFNIIPLRLKHHIPEGVEAVVSIFPLLDYLHCVFQMLFRASSLHTINLWCKISVWANVSLRNMFLLLTLILIVSVFFWMSLVSFWLLSKRILFCCLEACSSVLAVYMNKIMLHDCCVRGQDTMTW